MSAYVRTFEEIIDFLFTPIYFMDDLHRKRMVLLCCITVYYFSICMCEVIYFMYAYTIYCF